MPCPYDRKDNTLRACGCQDIFDFLPLLPKIDAFISSWPTHRTPMFFSEEESRTSGMGDSPENGRIFKAHPIPQTSHCFPAPACPANFTFARGST